MSGLYEVSRGASCNSNTYCPTCITGPNGGALGIGGVAVWCKKHEMISREQAEAEYGAGKLGGGGNLGPLATTPGIFIGAGALVRGSRGINGVLLAAVPDFLEGGGSQSISGVGAVPNGVRVAVAVGKGE